MDQQQQQQQQTDEVSFSSKHPILSLLLNGDSSTRAVVDVATLGDFVDYSLRNGNSGFVPYTLTEFYGEYLSFSVVRFLQKDRRRFQQRNLLWDIDSTIGRLARLAYLSKIKGTAITKRRLLRILFPERRRDDDTLRLLEWKLGSFGLLEEVVEAEKGTARKPTFVGLKSRKVERLNFIDDSIDFNDKKYGNDEDDDDGDDDENSEKADFTGQKEKKQGRWLAITGRLKRKSSAKEPEQSKIENITTRSIVNKGVGVDNEKQREAGLNYRFRESGVEEFLVAKYHFDQFVRKCISSDGIVALTPSMRRSVRKLPSTGAIWRMTLGLLGKSDRTAALIRGVVSEIIEECKLGGRMTPVDITALCVEAVYESANASNLAEILEEFTFNQSISYSSANASIWSRHRLPYAVSAVGYLVRTSATVYGLHLAYLQLDSNTVAMLADPVNAVSDNHLQVLNLSGNFELGASAVRRLMRFLVKASHLTHLDLAGCLIGDQGLRLLAEFFECWPLQFLRVSSNAITDVGIPSLTRNFKYVPTLEWLDLSDNRISDRTAAILAAALPVLPRLRSLDLRRNQLGDFGTDVLTRGLDRLRRIRSLVLAENQIGERGASALARNLWKTKSLRYVNVSLNNIPSSTIVGLRRAASSGSTLIRVSAEVQHRSACDLSSAASSTEHVYTTGVVDDDAGGGEGYESDDDATDDGRGWKSTGDVRKSVDLLAGRRDEVPLNERTKGLRPRRGPLTRSWHGLNESIRSSFRRSKRSVTDVAT